MQQHAEHRIEWLLPGSFGNLFPGNPVACGPPGADAGRGEIDVLAGILAVETRRPQRNDVHQRATSPTEQFLDFGFGYFGLRQQLAELGQVVELPDNFSDKTFGNLRPKKAMATNKNTYCTPRKELIIAR